MAMLEPVKSTCSLARKRVYSQLWAGLSINVKIHDSLIVVS